MFESKYFIFIITILFVLLYFAARMRVGNLEEHGFKRKKLFLPLAKIHVIYFTSITNEKPDEETVNQLELVLANAGYRGSAFKNDQFNELAANLGYHHIVFTEDL
ncbi:MAG: hypothetical protein V4686_00450 [Patescibacteria group bacterium]